MRDLVRRFIARGPATVDALVRPVVRVPMDLPADGLVGILRQRRAHQAIVVDAADHAVGLITFQDVLEALLGAALTPCSPGSALVLLAALVLMNSLFVAAEFAVVGLPRAAIATDAERGDRGARRLLAIVTSPSDTIAISPRRSSASRWPVSVSACSASTRSRTGSSRGCRAPRGGWSRPTA